jgi:hypothetical protein
VSGQVHVLGVSSELSSTRVLGQVHVLGVSILPQFLRFFY